MSRIVSCIEPRAMMVVSYFFQTMEVYYIRTYKVFDKTKRLNECNFNYCLVDTLSYVQCNERKGLMTMFTREGLAAQKSFLFRVFCTFILYMSILFWCVQKILSDFFKKKLLSTTTIKIQC